MQNEKSLVLAANKELNAQISDPSVMRALTATVFKGFRDEQVVKQACLEAMMRGYTFQDIINKKIYAIPFGSGYSLVQSIADVRAIAMKSGQAGKSAPTFEEDEKGKIISCTVTVQRRVEGYVGDYTATVYFAEYDKKKDNWVSKPRTMIAKVAEMHALRMAFPEELSLAYVEEEFDKEASNIKNRLEVAQDESAPLKMGNFLEKPATPKTELPHVSAPAAPVTYGSDDYLIEESEKNPGVFNIYDQNGEIMNTAGLSREAAEKWVAEHTKK